MTNESRLARPFIRLAILLLAAGILSQAQTVWFTPLAASQHPVGYFGATDYMQLFNPAAPWRQAASHVNVLKIYADGVDSLSDKDFRALLSNLRQRKIALALEWPMLSSATCGLGIEGFGAGIEPLLKRIKTLGGTLNYIAMQQPFQWGSLYKGPRSCQWTARQVAANAMIEVNVAKKYFPKILIGDIMAVPPFRDAASDWAAQYGVWFETWRKLSGAPLAFFHVDGDWTVPNWQAAVAQIRPVAASHHIPFGMVYNGFLTDESDASWMAAAESHVIDYEVRGGNAAPEQVNFQTWNPHPTHVLPETDPTAFTYLIDRYFRTRTHMTLANNGAEIRGMLRAGSAPVPGATLQIYSQAVSGSGTVATYTLTGTVPAEARNAIVGARFNSECYACSGTVDVTVYSFLYGENNQRKPAAWEFAKGIAGWSYGPGVPVFESGPAPHGQGLHIKAQPGQAPGINSNSVPVTPGAQFRLQVVARVPPSSAGAGYFTLIWLNKDGAEPAREILMLQAESHVVGIAATAKDGTFSLANAIDPKLFKVSADYPGSAALWPAIATAANR